jgi:DNA polymerase sigma
MATGLAIDSSDLDIAVSGAFDCTGPLDEKKNMINALAALNKNLEGLPYVRTKQFISSAMVPVIKLLVDFD